jgi:hypothetical protein
MTLRGVILGTAAYMSPEQASGKMVDKRSDLWAFGVVLLEMLTGQPVFTGETASHFGATRMAPLALHAPPRPEAAGAIVEEDAAPRSSRLSEPSAKNPIERLSGAQKGYDAPLVVSEQPKVPTSWSADGRFLLYDSRDPQTGEDLWIVPMAPRRSASPPVTGRAAMPAPSVFLKTPFRELAGAFSPDGRWVAYMPNESGRMEIYVRPFVNPEGPPGADRWRAVADLIRGRRLPALAARRQGDLLSQPGRRHDGGGGRTQGTDARRRRAGEALSAACVRRRHPRPRLRRRPGRALLDQHRHYGAVAPITLVTNWSPRGGR